MSAQEREIISVAELTRRLRRSVERVTGHEWVEGEVGSVRQAASGHLYFALKDEREEALVDCVIYRSTAIRARRHIFDGARIQVFGKATLWAPRGRLQLIADAVRPAGLGAQLEALEKLKEKLQAEGLFDPERKRSLPTHPRCVGVVTSAHGAALHDVRTVCFRRAPVLLVFVPCAVQGEAAAASIVQALELLNKDTRVEVVIVGRGGGSDEDLMAFNDERVVRQVARARVPVISAVGHEVDVTLTDLVADVRAATPSQAAEFAVPDMSAQIALLTSTKRRLAQAMHSRLRDDSLVLQRLRYQLADPRFLIAERQQLLDDYRFRLERRITRLLGRRREQLSSAEQRLMRRHPRAVLSSARLRLGPLSGRLASTMRLLVGRKRGRLSTAAAQLQALSPLTVLSRGYSLTTDRQGQIIRDAKRVNQGDELRVRLHHGALDVRVDRSKEEADG